MIRQVRDIIQYIRIIFLFYLNFSPVKKCSDLLINQILIKDIWILLYSREKWYENILSVFRR